MKKQFLNLGKSLSKTEQQKINGGLRKYRDCPESGICSDGTLCFNYKGITGCPLILPTNG